MRAVCQTFILFDLTDLFCQKEICKAVEEGKVIYRDDNHLTGSFANSLAPVLETKLLSIVPTLPDFAAN